MAASSPATPERHLRELRRAQREDRERIREIEERIARRGDDIERWRAEDRRVNRLDRADVKAPWSVLVAADRAAARADVPELEFTAMALVVLRKETGIPQRNIYGCDHGPRTGPPYCNQAVTEANAAPFIRWVLADPYAGRMNGMSWTQTTWFEKLKRVLDYKGAPPHDPRAHMHVCFYDLAVLRKAYGVGEAFERYNGSGPAAAEYRRVCESWMPWARELVTG